MFFRFGVAIAAIVLSTGSLNVLEAIARPQVQSIQFAQAQSRPKRPSSDSWLKNLNLSQEQLQKVRDIRSQYQERLSQQRQAVRQAQNELKQSMASNASAEETRQKFEQLQTLKRNLADTRMESMLAIRGILTPEQRQKLNEAMSQFGRGGRDRAGD